MKFRRQTRKKQSVRHRRKRQTMRVKQRGAGLIMFRTTQEALNAWREFFSRTTPGRAMTKDDITDFFYLVLRSTETFEHANFRRQTRAKILEARAMYPELAELADLALLRVDSYGMP